MWCAITIDCSSSGLWISIYMKRWRGYMYLHLINSRIWKPIGECINIEIPKRNMTSTQPVQLHQRQGLNERFAESSWLGWRSSVVARWSLAVRPYKVQAPHRPKRGKGREPIHVGKMRRLILAWEPRLKCVGWKSEYAPYLAYAVPYIIISILLK